MGPESAGAHPGPVCYRKGGYAAITDANLVLGRILPDFFPNIFGPNEDQPLDADAARHALEELTKQINDASPGQPAKSVDEVGPCALCADDSHNYFKCGEAVIGPPMYPCKTQMLPACA